MKKFMKIGKWIIIVLVGIIIIGLVGAAMGDDKPKEENDPKQTEESDQKYLDTREYIWNFLLDKDYEVQTTAGVPNIGKKDIDLDEGYEGWYAYIKRDGEWKEFSVVLFDGEVSAIQPVQ